MSIETEITRITENVAATYSELEELGADMPAAYTSDNLAVTAASLKTKIITPQMYGAKGDGTTDDTTAFQNALAANRLVYVPGGTYKLSAGISIADNCELKLAQDTVLNFTQTTGNCITLNMSSSLRGNHATVNVPYAFSGNVLYAYSADATETEQNAVSPWTRWTPQWKSGRYVTDLNICKPDSRGFHYSLDGTCSGTAVYLSANGSSGYLTYMWGLHYSGIRIAGAFSYGIRAVNLNDGWLHEMRIDAFIDACETGVSLEDCNNAYISAIIQPRRAYSTSGVYKAYAKHGIKLTRSKNTDLSGSRVWDWNATNTLWTSGGQYQHLCMYGECRGTILNDFLYYEQSSTDIRELIYTDTDTNLEQMTILQEPITRWFKPKDGEPYFFDGYTEQKLITQEDMDSHFETNIITSFTDVLSTAIDTDGTIYNGVGYKMGVYLTTSGGITTSGYYGTTGFIPCTQGSQIYASDLSLNVGDDNCRIVFYDSSMNYIMHVNRANIVAGNNYYVGYTETDNGFVCTVKSVAKLANVAYARITIYNTGFGSNPMMSINEEIKYSYEGFLADGIKVKGEDVLIYSPSGNVFKLTISDSGVIAPVQIN